jgi:hypothetical protein
MSTLVIVLRAVSLLAFAGPMLLRFIGQSRESRTRARHGGADRVPVAANLAAFALFLPSLVIFPGSSDSSLSLQLAGWDHFWRLRAPPSFSDHVLGAGPAWSLVAQGRSGDGSRHHRTLSPRPPSHLPRPHLLAAGEALAFSSLPAFAVVLFGIVPTFGGALAQRRHC